MVSRMIPYKRLDIVVDAFTKLKLPLKIVGSGRQGSAAESKCRAEYRVRGPVGDAQLKELYAECRAFVFPGEEDFGSRLWKRRPRGGR